MSPIREKEAQYIISSYHTVVLKLPPGYNAKCHTENLRVGLYVGTYYTVAPLAS